MKKYVSKEGKMIYSTLKQLIAKKEIEERRKISYRTISAETGISTGTLVRLCDFQGIKKIEANTIETLCRYFRCDVGDLLKFFDDPAEHLPDNPTEDQLWDLIGTQRPDDLPTEDDYIDMLDEIDNQ